MLLLQGRSILVRVADVVVTRDARVEPRPRGKCIEATSWNESADRKDVHQDGRKVQDHGAR